MRAYLIGVFQRLQLRYEQRIITIVIHDHVVDSKDVPPDIRIELDRMLARARMQAGLVKRVLRLLGAA